MEGLFSEIVKSSPILGLMLLFWFYQRKDYKEFVTQIQSENAKREENYQNTIKNLTSDLQQDVKEIKNHIFSK
ncbi:hypothetical protein [Desnuesiella massiliensis]|uniref:hypothetical protein n=1 Tax=Desnuesiella massiliensis TaxID=1650662 RepID=UPI0006E3208F|nr:hypothetical protein [Desnuesiella massiliensis]